MRALLFALTGVLGFWPSERAVRVFDVSISPAFTFEQRDAVIQALSSWENATPLVRFNVVGDWCNWHNAVHKLICVQPSDVANMTREYNREYPNAQLHEVVGLTHTWRAQGSIIKIADDQDPAEYMQVAAHEFGHALGLPDTHESRTLMNWQVERGVKGPTRADVRALLQVTP